jgi:hypothetical protein
MKAERKHELEHNELDDLLVKTTHFLRENGIVIAIVVIGLAIGAGVYAWRMATQSISADAGLWENYFLALSDSKDAERELESLIDEQDRRGQAAALPVLWSRLSLGNLKLSQGTRKLFENRDDAVQSLEEAETNFQAVEKNAARNPELRDRARMGLAEVYESLSRPEDARKYYGMVVKAGPDSPLGKLAARGERRMAQKANQEFLTWFAQQKPVKKPSSVTPFDMKDPPAVPDFSLPPLPGSDDKPITPGLKIPSKLPEDSSNTVTKRLPSQKTRRRRTRPRTKSRQKKSRNSAARAPSLRSATSCPPILCPVSHWSSLRNRATLASGWMSFSPSVYPRTAACNCGA